jgi:putative ABC transport system substrate-binding protein
VAAHGAGTAGRPAPDNRIPLHQSVNPALVRRLGELGWIDGRNVTIEYRWAEGRAERYVEVAAEFVRLKVDTLSGTAIATAKQETSTIPIVFAVAVDPERN